MSSGTRPNIWGFSSVGRALAWHARGHRFDPGNLHQKGKHCTEMCGAILFACLLRQCQKAPLGGSRAIRSNEEVSGSTLGSPFGRAGFAKQRLRGRGRQNVQMPLPLTGDWLQSVCSFATTKFMLDICGKLWYNSFCNCGYSTSASISAFQAEEVGSIPITRSTRPEP